ncbi:MAG TPA: thioredoxin family protein [Solirubrobacteraceae bacterium]
MALTIGDPAPEFELPDTKGDTWSVPDSDVESATVVLFTCNHCPYALAWQDRIAQTARDYADRGVRFLAINSNDSERYPRDSYEAMKKRVAAEDWPMPYLHDATQEVARAYAAEKTPHLFVLDADRRLRYAGAADADYDDPALRAQWLREALDAVLSGDEPARPQTRAVGCSIKWKP